jgi:hypothetical protein
VEYVGVSICEQCGFRAFSCAGGCTLDQAKDESVVDTRLWNYNGTSYDVIQGNDLAQPWRGVLECGIGGRGRA